MNQELKNAIQVLLNNAEIDLLNEIDNISLKEAFVLVKEFVNEKEIFPNGFDNWHETHFEIVKAITEASNIEPIPHKLELIVNMQGTGGLYELAESLTDKFERENGNKQWGIDEGLEYFEAIDLFINEHIY